MHLTFKLHLQEELGVEYETELHKRTPEKFAPKELVSIHPLGKSPIITDGKGDNKLVLAESVAIIGKPLPTLLTSR